MNLKGEAAAAFARRPDPAVTGVILFGHDAGRIALHRADLVAAVTEGDSMRLARLDPDTVRRDPAALADEARARGFFPGRRAVLVEGAKDGTAEAVGQALDGLLPEDALIVVTAPGLTAGAKLVKLFAPARDRMALAFYPDDAAEDPGDLLAAAGCTARPSPEAAEALSALARELDAGSFRQFCTTLALYAGEAAELTAEDVAALAPARPAAAEAVVAAATGGQADRVGPLMARLEASGSDPASAVSAATRHLALLHRCLTAPGGPRPAIEGMKAAVAVKRRLQADCSRWTPARAEQAMRLLFEAERSLRRSGPRPARAIAERALLRVAMMAAR